MSTVIHADDAQLKALIETSDKPILIDFVAPWCGACKAMAPALDAFAAAHADTLKVVKVDVDVAAEAAIEFKVRSLPTVLLLQKGERRGTHVGAMTQGQMTAFVAERLAA